MAKDITKKQLVQEVSTLRRTVEELEKAAGDLEQVEAASKRAAEKYRVIADNTYDWEFWISADGMMIYCSPSCERITGFSSSDFINNRKICQE